MELTTRLIYVLLFGLGWYATLDGVGIMIAWTTLILSANINNNK